MVLTSSVMGIMRLDWTIENLRFLERTKTLILTGLGGIWTVQSLRNLEPFEDVVVHLLFEISPSVVVMSQLAE